MLILHTDTSLSLLATLTFSVLVIDLEEGAIIVLFLDGEAEVQTG